MQIPLQITYRQIPPSEFVTAYIQKRASKLDEFFAPIMGCRVAVELPHRHKQHGQHFRVRIDITVFGAEIVIDRDPEERRTHEDLYAAVDAAFDDAKRALDAMSAKRREKRRRAAP